MSVLRLGCQVELAHKDGALSWVRGAYDAEVNDGQLCVRGRFCLPEATHHHSRARRPLVRKGAFLGWQAGTRRSTLWRGVSRASPATTS